tara:strand:+ start:85 stop:768 length:684 start_codon:yes stop_codon:yes gene_type:complete
MLVLLSVIMAGFVGLSVIMVVLSVNEPENDVERQISLARQSPSEGIQVHGNWQVEIYDVNGVLAETHVFQNQLTTEAKPILIDFLRASWPETHGVTKWELHGYGFEKDGVPHQPWSTENLDELLVYSVNELAASGIETVFTSNEDTGADCDDTTSTAPAGSTTIMLSVSCSFNQDANIGYFSTYFEYYVSSPIEDFKYKKYLTYKRLDPITVLAGQKVSVNMNISFD